MGSFAASVTSTEVANDGAVFPLQRQISLFASGITLDQIIGDCPRTGAVEFAMFSMTYGRDCETDTLRIRDASYTPFTEKCDVTRKTKSTANAGITAGNPEAIYSWNLTSPITWVRSHNLKPI